MTASWLRWQQRPKPFRARDFRRRTRYLRDYRRLAALLIDTLDFDSAFDVGCANAFLLDAFADAGRRIAGIDVSPEVDSVLPAHLSDHVEIGDFSEASGQWDLVCCVEVAEHIEPARSRELVATVTRLARRWIYFTAAPPGQSGRGHINCRPHAEWLGWLAELGWYEDAARTATLRERLGQLSDAPWLRTNSFLLRPDE